MKKLVRLVVIAFVFLLAVFIGWFNYAQEETSTTLLQWTTLNITIKNLAWDSVSSSNANDFKVKYFKEAEYLTTEYETWIISEDWEIPIYAWFDTWDETIYYYTTANTIYMNAASNSMFYNFQNIKEIDLAKFDTSKVTSMKSMFFGCKKLEKLDLSNFKTNKVTNMQTMFNECRELTGLDLSTFDTRNVKRMKKMFYNTYNLEKIYVSEFFDVSNLISGDEGSTSMFEGANVLEWWKWTKVSDKWVYDATYARIDEGPDSANPWYFTEKTIEESILLPWKEINKIIKDLADPSWTHTYLSRDGKIKSIKHTNIETLPSTGYAIVTMRGVENPVYARYDNDTIYYCSESDTIYMNPDSSYMFAYLTGLKEIDLSSFVTSGVTSMESMFNACQSLETLDLSNFDTSNVTNMHAMFNACHKLTELDLSTFDTSNVTTMESMFSECYSWEELDLSTFDTSNVTNMHAMFNGCHSLTELDLRNFDTSNVTTMQTMFYNCKGLTTLDLSSFNTENVTNMEKMFDGKTVNNSNKLTTLDLSSFNTENVTNMEWMFDNLPNLTTVYVSGSFSIDALDVNSMFLGDAKLVWWNGTKFINLEVVDKTYAKIDSETQSWYFTDVGNITVKYINIDNGNETVQYTTGMSKWSIITWLTQNEIEQKTWNSLGYYIDSWMTDVFDFSQPIMKYTEIYTQREANQYTITFILWNGDADIVITQNYESNIVAPANPTREWYDFVWWDSEIPASMPAENLTITAKWEAKKSWNWWSWWWRHNNSDNESAWNKENDIQELDTITDDNTEKDNETQKQDNTQSVHEWSYQNWLTQYVNEKDARFWDYLTRSEMAKLSSIFATKMLWKTPDKSKEDFCSQYVDLSKLNTEMKSYVIESCELWYMWYQFNWIDALAKFRPYSPVTLAEASVIVSRMLRWNQNVIDETQWYQGHLYAAYNHELIDDIRNPFRNITRWETFEMFYKSLK